MWLYFVSFEVVFREYQESKRQTSNVKQSIYKTPTVVSVWSQLKQIKSINVSTFCQFHNTDSVIQED